MGDRIKVLCVDDNQEATRSCARLLEMAGCEVRVCHDGPSALSVAEEFRPDECVIDLKMPGMGGEELAARLRERGGGRPVRCIALTGLWDIDAQHRTGPNSLVALVLWPLCGQADTIQREERYGILCCTVVSLDL